VVREVELDEEIRTHFRMAIEERVRRGEPRDEAERAVRREFGNVLQVKETTRAMWGGLWWETLVQDCRYALRALRRTPAFSVTAVVTLALGIGSATGVFMVANGVLLRPLPYPDPDRLVLVTHGPPPGPFLTTSGMADRDYLELRNHDIGFEKLATFSNQPVTLTGAGEPARLNAAFVTTEFFAVLGVPCALGRGFAADEGSPGRDGVVVLGDELWRSRFAADPGVIDATVTLDGVSRTVVGVMPPGFDFPNGADLWLPLEIRIDPRNGRSRAVAGRLTADATLQGTRAGFASFTAGLPPPDGEVVSSVEPLGEYLVRNVRHVLLLFLGAVCFVLLIASANVANLVLMRTIARGHEIALRASLGAGRGRLTRQLLTEGLVLALLGGSAGVLLAWAGVEALMRIVPAGRIPRIESVRFDGVVIGSTVSVALIAGLALSLLPALYASRHASGRALGTSGRTSSRGGRRVRGALALGQIALALILLTGAGLMVRSFHNMLAVELGFRPADVLTMTVDLPTSNYPDAGAMRALHDRVLEGLAASPAVQEAGAVNWRPFGTRLVSGDFTVENGPDLPRGGYWAAKLAVSPDYFGTMGIRLVRGRVFTAADRAVAPGVVVVSRSLADRFWPAGDAVGRRLALRSDPEPPDWLTIVGVVDDVLQREITGAREAAIYSPYAQVTRPFFLDRMTYVARSAADSQTVATAMRAAVRAADPDLPVHTVASMDELVGLMTAQPRFQSWLLAALSLIALVLAAVGVYGVLAYAVTQQRFEIGVRMALGARASDVMGNVLRRSLSLIAAGLLLGVAGSAAVTGVLRGYLFQIAPTDPMTFLASTALLALTALLAAWLPARRAARVDPVAVLKSE
jgi:putative ABC transport system permease protein